ncbi:hypothetical protein IWQ60_001087 [Tieghemiomyces parasiticus]|uniref:Uncharacterized protein n=1 Tax=Tieghemiomyces parasiticus TaxID=78921 RepID=A0A9W8E288_9FUNG|nr:hypothetical protein IWQ60_001087 [Tieghemiomyces parasiticus]
MAIDSPAPPAGPIGSSSPAPTDQPDRVDESGLSAASHLITPGQPPLIAPSTTATYAQASQPVWQQLRLRDGGGSDHLASYDRPSAVAAGPEFIHSLPTDIDFDQLEALEADYRAMMNESSRIMLSLSQNKSPYEIQIDLLKASV